MTIDGWILLVVAIAEIVNISLLLGLLYVYWGNYKEAKSKFSIGLLFFASTFLVKSILFLIGILVFISGIISPMAENDDGHGITFLFLLNIIECIALAILFKITWE